MEKKIEKVKSVDIHVDFANDDRFGIAINGDHEVGGSLIAIEELRKIARTLTRVAIEMWNEIDNVMGGGKA